MSTCKLDKDKVCSVCEKIGELVECSGHCGQHFHPSCVQFENKPEQTYTCPECVSGKDVILLLFEVGNYQMPDSFVFVNV